MITSPEELLFIDYYLSIIDNILSYFNIFVKREFKRISRDANRVSAVQ
jgi:hypothetical protein